MSAAIEMLKVAFSEVVEMLKVTTPATMGILKVTTSAAVEMLNVAISAAVEVLKVAMFAAMEILEVTTPAAVEMLTVAMSSSVEVVVKMEVKVWLSVAKWKLTHAPNDHSAKRAQVPRSARCHHHPVTLLLLPIMHSRKNKKTYKIYLSLDDADEPMNKPSM
ncbi:hypothetical protein JTB14_027112 [Gonioctena quinquepunctata]|nr:hypothetical protein JTB14_027112 [Gonioctena quinquepunctata]